MAIGIEVSRLDARAIKQQMISTMEELGATKEEIMDVLRVVLITSGMPAFNKAVKILNSI